MELNYLIFFAYRAGLYRSSWGYYWPWSRGRWRNLPRWFSQAISWHWWGDNLWVLLDREFMADTDTDEGKTREHRADTGWWTENPLLVLWGAWLGKTMTNIGWCIGRPSWWPILVNGHGILVMGVSSSGQHWESQRLIMVGGGNSRLIWAKARLGNPRLI